jgi:hypothetical protein
VTRENNNILIIIVVVVMMKRRVHSGVFRADVTPRECRGFCQFVQRVFLRPSILLSSFLGYVSVRIATALVPNIDFHFISVK